MQRTSDHIVLSPNRYFYNTTPPQGTWQQRESRTGTFVVRSYVLEMPGKLQPGSLKSKAAKQDQNKDEANKHAI